MENGYLIVGLGNPGEEYARTRHNAGFLVIDRLGDGLRVNWEAHSRFSALLAKVEWEGRRIVLCKPQTYMNASGAAVGAVLNYFRIPVAGLLVLVDDADLPLGELRLRGGGSSGGHHGLESVEAHLGTREYARLRIGIGRQPGGRREIAGYVLGRFGAEQLELLDHVLDAAVKQVKCWVASGLLKAMNEFNGVVKTPVPKES